MTTNNILALAEHKGRSTNFFSDNNKFLHDVLSVHLMKKHHIITVEGQLHLYENGRYVSGEDSIKRKIVELLPELKEAQRKEVIHQLYYITEQKEHSEPRYICIKNGVYDIENDELLEHSPKFILTSQINAEYNINAKCGHIDDLLETVSASDGEVVQLLKELIGYTLYRSNIFGKSFILKGEGGNGKSTLLHAISSLIGIENITAFSLSEIGGQFNTGLIAGKLANIGDDIPYTTIKDTDAFKKLTTGDLIKGEHKNQTPFFFRSFAKLIFSSNRLPRISDDSQGFKDRFVIVPLNARIRGTNKQDVHFEDKITTDEARSYLLNIGIESLKSLLKKGGFITPEVVTREFEAFEISNNPVAEWLNEHYENGQDIHQLPVSSAYMNYKDYCKHNNYKSSLSQNKLTLELKSHGYDSKRIYINSSQVRCYLNNKTHKTQQDT